jgi:RNA exonuclease 1
MFSTSGLFKNIPCPNGAEKCTLINCLFSHAPKEKPAPSEPPKPATVVGAPTWKPSDSENEAGDPKRRKLYNGSKQVSVPQFGAPFTGLSPPMKPVEKSPLPENLLNVEKPALVTARRPISPPALGSRGKMHAVAATKPGSTASDVKKFQGVNATLTPRSVPKDPVPYMKRHALLQELHKAMVKLNDEVAKSPDTPTAALHMSKNDLIIAAQDEEESFARGKSSVYDMMVKLRISAMRKMKLDEWKTLRLEITKKAESLANPKTEQKEDGKKPVNLDIELSLDQQLLMLNRFILKPHDLKNAGYIMSPPTEADIQKSKEAVEASGNYETCDRCETRFQVFPGGREDGALTTNGKCRHHWGKLRRPEKKKTDVATGTSREQVYMCCNQPQGSPGCTVAETHVYKITGPHRLASILPFEVTPDNSKASNDLAIAFDCEMAWTTCGLELIRLSATNWPQGEALIDVLVRPCGEILDLNTRFSGISLEQYFGAIPYDSKEDEGPSPGTDKVSEQIKPLRIVSSPAAARDLLLSNITTSTPLIGHALDNDMNVLRLIHPTIIDTSLLFAHPAGLPIRYGLKYLVSQFLNRDIQTGGDAGHDSLEDSRATGDLVRWKMRREWDKLKQEGWIIKGGLFHNNASKDPGKIVPLPAYTQATFLKGQKRKAES